MDVQGHDLGSWVGNTIAASTVLTAIAGIVPPVAAVIAIIWYMIQITESETYRNWRKNRLQRKMLKLRERLHLLEALDRQQNPDEPLPPA